MRRVALLALLVLAGCVGGGKSQPLTGLPLSGKAPNFTLEDQAGKQVSLAQERGHWAVVTFLYTRCPDVCPLIAANLNAALATPAGKSAGLRVLAVSVDPVHDTLRAVKRYVVEHRLRPSFRYLIGTRSQLAKVWAAYHIAERPGPKGTVTHSAQEFLIDPKGNERLIYDATITTAQLSGDLTKLGV